MKWFGSTHPPPTATSNAAPVSGSGGFTMEGGGGGGGGAIELRRRMAAQCLAFERQIADGRERTKAAASAFSAALLSARSLSNHTISQRGIGPSSLLE